MLRTNWYNCFRKNFMGDRFCKKLAIGAKIQNQKICYILVSMTLKARKLANIETLLVQLL